MIDNFELISELIKENKEKGKLQRVKELLVQGMKRCTDCKNDLLLSEFSKNKTDNTGYSSVCYNFRIKEYGLIKLKQKII